MPNPSKNRCDASKGTVRSLRLRAGCHVLAVGLVSVACTVVPGLLISGARGEPLDSSASAAEVLQDARDNREVLSATFPGFRSKLTVHKDGRVLHGACTFRLPGRLEVVMHSGEDIPVVTASIRSMLMHRAPSRRTSPQEARFGKLDANPLGRQLLLSDSYESAYRIREGEILQVDRRLSEPHFVVTVLETRKTESGRYLPRTVFAVRFDPDTGSVKEAWSYLSEFQRVSGEYLPKSRKVVRTEQGRTSTYFIEWSDVKLLDPES